MDKIVETFPTQVFDEIYRFNVLHKGSLIENTKEGHAKAIYDFLIDDMESECTQVNQKIATTLEEKDEELSDLSREVDALEQELKILDDYSENIQDFIAHLRDQELLSSDVLDSLLDDFNLKINIEEAA